jgi:hypothetical protein
MVVTVVLTTVLDGGALGAIRRLRNSCKREKCV